MPPTGRVTREGTLPTGGVGRGGGDGLKPEAYTGRDTSGRRRRNHIREGPLTNLGELSRLLSTKYIGKNRKT